MGSFALFSVRLSTRALNRAALVLCLVTPGVQGAAAEPITTCTQGRHLLLRQCGLPCGHPGAGGAPSGRALRPRRAAGKATGYISIPISNARGQLFQGQ